MVPSKIVLGFTVIAIISFISSCLFFFCFYSTVMVLVYVHLRFQIVQFVSRFTFVSIVFSRPKENQTIIRKTKQKRNHIQRNGIKRTTSRKKNQILSPLIDQMLSLNFFHAAPFIMCTKKMLIKIYHIRITKHAPPLTRRSAFFTRALTCVLQPNWLSAETKENRTKSIWKETNAKP